MSPNRRPVRVIDSFQEHYRLLGIDATADPDQLKTEYKKQMRRWHPDRFGHDNAELRQAEERAKEINFAYQAITEFHEANGHMPVEDIHPEATETPRPTFDPPPKMEPRNWTPPPGAYSEASPPSWFRVIAVVAIAGTIAFGFFGEKHDSGDGPNEPVATASDTPAVVVAPPGLGDDSPRFGPGSTVSEVYAVQGVPDKVSADVWHYGDARVVFNHGRVIHWTDATGRLKVRGNEGASMAATPSTFFHKGSSREEVRAIQGAPIRDTGTVWEYGMSRVYFDHNGLVVDWKESALDPLRVRH